jgi:hypothetical protein
LFRRAFTLPRFAAAFALLLVGVGLAVFVHTRSESGARIVRERGGAEPSPAADAASELAARRVKEKGADNQPAEGTEAPTSKALANAGAAVANVSRRVSAKGRPARGAAPPSVLGGARSVRRVVPDEEFADDHLLDAAEQKYKAAIAKLMRDANRERIEPEVKAQFDKSLTALDRAIARTQRAVRDNPGDPVAAQYMIAAYSKKVDVLIEMTHQGGY